MIDGSDLSPPEKAVLLAQACLSNRLDTLADIYWSAEDIVTLGAMCGGLARRCAEAEGVPIAVLMSDLGLRAAVAGRK